MEPQSTQILGVHLSSKTREVVLVAMLSAIYVAYALVSGFAFGYITHGVDNFLVRSLLFVILIAMSNRLGLPSMMGATSGLVLEFFTPSPIHFYILPSVAAYGISFDLFVNIRRKGYEFNRRRIILATALSSAIMSIVALAVFTIVGFFPPAILPIIWTFGILRDVVIGLVGGLIGLTIVQNMPHLRG